VRGLFQQAQLNERVGDTLLKKLKLMFVYLVYPLPVSIHD